MPGKTLKEAFGELTVTTPPSGFLTVGRVYFQSEPDGLRIMWRHDGFNWEGRCVSPRIVNGAPTATAIVNNEVAIDISFQTTYYVSAGAGSTTWLQMTEGTGGGGC